MAVLATGAATGEVTMLSGRRGFVRMRAGEPGAVLEVERDDVLALVQTDSEFGEILLRGLPPPSGGTDGAGGQRRRARRVGVIGKARSASKRS